MLKSEQRLVYYYLYVILDIFSRYVVGWLIADRESKELARQLIQKTILKQGVEKDKLILHADNGPSMKSQSVAQLLAHLGVIKSHTRPYQSNDNPFSESQFKTMKYCPTFPTRFPLLENAEQFCLHYFNWYNTKHDHSNICWLTPESVHYGDANDMLFQRHLTLMNAYNKDPVRFNRTPPILKSLPLAVYINPPDFIDEESLQSISIVA